MRDFIESVRAWTTAALLGAAAVVVVTVGWAIGRKGGGA